MSEDTQKGQVKWFDVEKGFGFITGDDGKDVFAHHSTIAGSVALNEGDLVSFKSEEGIRKQTKRTTAVFRL